MPHHNSYELVGSNNSLPTTFKSEDKVSSQSLMLETQDTSYSRSQTPIIENGKALDEKDVEDTPELTFRRAMAVIAMAFLWTSSQIPMYFYGGIQLDVLKTIGGWSKAVWIGLGILIPLAIVTPFIGTLSDLFGRRNLGLSAFVLIIAGNLCCALAHSINVFIAGTVLISVGAGIGELISLAVTAEVAPTKSRGLYIGAVVTTIIPFTPAVLYAQLITYASTWRWIGLLVGGWSFIGFVLTFVFYRPPHQKRFQSRRELLRQIDWVGGFLSAAGICLFLAGLALPTAGISWADPRVITSLVIGGSLLAGFAVWEYFFAHYPMFPARLKEKNPRVLAIIILITFVSGANFFAVMIYWPTQYQNVYAKDSPISMGLGSLPVGLGIMAGSIIATPLVSILKGRIKLLMILSCVVMTAGNGTMAIASRDNLPVMWAVVTIACIGVGAAIVPTQVIAGIVCPDDLLATITAVTITVRILGGTIGYAIYSDIFSTKFASVAKRTIVPMLVEMGIKSAKDIEAIIVTLRGGGYYDLPALGFTNQTQIALLASAGKDAQLSSFPVVYYAAVGFGVLSIVASFFLTGIEDQMKDGAAVKFA